MSCCCCFPPSARVLTTAGYVRVADLKPWHRLLVVTPPKARVPHKDSGVRLTETCFCTYLHYDPNIAAEFLVLVCDNGAELIISEKHLLFKVDQTQSEDATVPVAVRAKEVTVGDSLVFVDADSMAHPKVIRIETRTIEGVYAPLSGKGTLIVDGFQVSCYAEIEPSSHGLAHAATAPLRAWCRKIGTKQSPRVDGIHGYAKVLAAIRGINISDG